MNPGRSAGAAARYYQIDPSRIAVFHDELDLPPGKVRVKTGGGNAGHNGLKSLSAHIGNDYRRVRIGICYPGDKTLVHDQRAKRFPPRLISPGSKPYAALLRPMPGF